jgi:putative selenium metabolism protein SsnA
MSETYLLGPGAVVTGGATPQVIGNGGVAWQRERVVAVATWEELLRRFPAARGLDAHGGMILPGLVNLHHHFYSALARGLDPAYPLRDFADVLSRLWWRLDRALTPETVRVSALLAAADCIRWGCTTVFDHHASPACVRGSLDLIAGAVAEAGLSAVLCYEVSDRNGHGEALAGLDENLDFVARHRADPRIRGMLGLHASFTVRDDTLAAAASLRPAGAGCHVHLAEDRLDVERSRQLFGARPLARLAAAGLLDERAILAHGVHLEPEEYDTVARSGALLVHNPESNANNGVGRLDPLAAAAHGCTLCLGTDGMSSAMLRSLRAAFLALRHAERDPSAGFAVLPGLLPTNARVAGRFLDEPLLGELAPGAPADIAVVDAPPPTPIAEGNLFGHLVYGASEAPVRFTVARGRVLLDDFRLTTIDPEELARQAAALAPALWQRFRDLEPSPDLAGD